MKKAIETSRIIVRCDASGCDYQTETDDIPSFHNKPCPDCGTNLLTTKDLNDYIKMSEVIDNINDAIGDCSGSDSVIIPVSVETNGEGFSGVKVGKPIDD